MKLNKTLEDAINFKSVTTDQSILDDYYDFKTWCWAKQYFTKNDIPTDEAVEHFKEYLEFRKMNPMLHTRLNDEKRKRIIYELMKTDIE